MIPVILSGGSGTRLWPLSRQLFPKQFLPLSSENSMLQETFSRLDGLTMASPIIVCNEEHRFIVAEQLRAQGIENGQILLEPVARNTAPAIAMAAFEAVNKDKDAILLVLAADHVIGNVEHFHQAVVVAEQQAKMGKMVTFGIVPTNPEIGYGYIKRGTALDQGSFMVDSFVEKPDLPTAESYLLSGDYFWNSGMFMFKASRYLEELKQYRPDIYDACSQVSEQVDRNFDFIRLDKAYFSACPSESIDYAVMEKTRDAVVVSLDASWNDVGSWSALWDIHQKDSDGNVLVGDVITLDVTNSYCHGTHRLVTAVGVESLIIVETPDSIMVASKDRVQDVKQIVEKLNKAGRQESVIHRKAERPWGSYDCIDQGDRFQAKRIIVKPGAALSLQMHHHRAEHWIVVRGTAKVTRGEETFLVSENESTYIPIGTKHRLENPGVVPLEIIEIQSGSYLGEDDIVRFEDTYGRS